MILGFHNKVKDAGRDEREERVGTLLKHFYGGHSCPAPNPISRGLPGKLLKYVICFCNLETEGKCPPYA